MTDAIGTVFSLFLVLGVPVLTGYLSSSRKAGIAFLSILPGLIFGGSLLMSVILVSENAGDWGSAFLIGGFIVAGTLFAVAMAGFAIGRLISRRRSSRPANNAGWTYCAFCGRRLQPGATACLACGATALDAGNVLSVPPVIPMRRAEAPW